jgi:hypothetical protein
MMDETIYENKLKEIREDTKKSIYRSITFGLVGALAGIGMTVESIVKYSQKSDELDNKNLSESIYESKSENLKYDLREKMMNRILFTFTSLGYGIGGTSVAIGQKRRRKKSLEKELIQ